MHEVECAVIDLAVEAAMPAHRVGENFHAIVLDAEEKRITVALTELVVRARCYGRLPGRSGSGPG